LFFQHFIHVQRGHGIIQLVIVAACHYEAGDANASSHTLWHDAVVSAWLSIFSPYIHHCWRNSHNLLPVTYWNLTVPIFL